jgi:predicted  nucleic acid-binding Zn-ribbon protein
MVRKSRDSAADNYQDRISDLEKRLEAAAEDHRRMRRELEDLEERDPYHILRTIRPIPHLDDDARN